MSANIWNLTHPLRAGFIKLAPNGKELSPKPQNPNNMKRKKYYNILNLVQWEIRQVECRAIK